MLEEMKPFKAQAWVVGESMNCLELRVGAWKAVARSGKKWQEGLNRLRLWVPR